MNRNCNEIYRLLDRIARTTKTLPIATDVARSVVCVLVCFGHTGELCKNG